MKDKEKSAVQNPDQVPQIQQGQDMGRFNNIGQFIVTAAELPLSCPMKGEPLWDAHPKVYLPIEEAGKVTCPYCSAEYILEERLGEFE